MTRDGAFSTYVEEAWPRLVRSAVLLGCSSDEAEDLVQTLLIRCFVSWSRVARARDRDAYVYRMLLNAQVDSRRRRWWRETPHSDLPEVPTPDTGVHVDDGEVVRRALNRLPQAQHRVVVLRYYADLSEQQTAEVLGIPRGTVKSRLSRALAELASDAELVDLNGGSRP